MEDSVPEASSIKEEPNETATERRERLNKEFNERFPTEYNTYRDKLVAELGAQIAMQYRRKEQDDIEKLKSFYKQKMKKEKEEAAIEMNNKFQQEIERIEIEEEENCKRREQDDCKMEYKKIEEDIINAKENGEKICLYCGCHGVRHSCQCGQAFYCNDACMQQHTWVHKQHCRPMMNN
eukprot:gene14023-15482_t